MFGIFTVFLCLFMQRPDVTAEKKVHDEKGLDSQMAADLVWKNKIQNKENNV